MSTQPLISQSSSTNFQRHIRYPRFIQLNSEIHRCKELSKISSEPQCMSLEGEPGAGKTTLIRDYAAAYPRKIMKDGIEIPVFYSDIPSPATVKATAITLLKKLGDPAAEKGTLPVMNDRLVGFIKDCKVEIVILDEFSNLIDTETDHVLNQVSNWLKMLIKDTCVPFLVVGISGKVDRILNANAQLSRLFAYREILKPFSLDNTERTQEFTSFIKHSQNVIGICLSPNIPKGEVLYRIFYATDGVVGNIMNLLRYAGIFAKERNSEFIELTDLEIAFHYRIEKYLRHKINPFTTPIDEVFYPNIQSKETNHRMAGIMETLTTR